jgi:preprotein translocase subunit SecY
MTSAIEQLASTPWSGFSKASELKKRLLFVMGALLVYRLGTFIPIPGIDPAIWNEIYSQKGGGLLDMFNMFSGGALKRMTIFALNVMPYISASIIIQLGTSLHPHLEALKKEGEMGRMKINQYTRYLTVFLAAIQGYGMAVGLEHATGHAGAAVIYPGLFFRIQTVITIVGGVVFLMWLGEQITQRGVGNGTSLIIFAGIAANLPRAVISTLELGREGQFNPLEMLLIVGMVIGVITFIVYIERAQRRIVVQYPKRQVGNQMQMGNQNFIPLKINMSGVIPPIFASSLLLLPLSVVGFLGGQGGDFMAGLTRYLQPGSPVHMLLYGSLIIFFTFFYTAVVFNPTDNADMLRRYGGFIPGIRPGTPTAEYFDYVLTRIAAVGALYLTFICLLPEVLIAKYSLPFTFGGTSLLIVVTVTMDTMAQIHSHLIAHQYEGLIRKSKLGKRK